jgi:hypothetical protein
MSLADDNRYALVFFQGQWFHPPEHAVFIYGFNSFAHDFLILRSFKLAVLNIDCH